MSVPNVIPPPLPLLESVPLPELKEKCKSLIVVPIFLFESIPNAAAAVYLITLDQLLSPR